MSLPAFASLEDLGARLPGGVASGDEARAQAALDDASARIREVASPTTWADGDDLDFTDAEAWVEPMLKAITCAAARRSLVNPDGMTGEQLGAWSGQFGNASPDVFLTKAEQKQVRKAAGKREVWTQRTTRTDHDQTDLPAIFVDTVYPDDTPGEPMPWQPHEVL